MWSQKFTKRTKFVLISRQRLWALLWFLVLSCFYFLNFFLKLVLWTHKLFSSQIWNRSFKTVFSKHFFFPLVNSRMSKTCVNCVTKCKGPTYTPLKSNFTNFISKAFYRQLMPFSKHRPSGPMLSISRNVRQSVCPSVRLCVCSLLMYRLNVFLPPLPKVGCPIFLEFRNPWGKVMERSGLRFEHFCLKVV